MSASAKMDAYHRLQKTDLMQALGIMASFVYHAATRDEMLRRKPFPKPQPRTGTIFDVTASKIGDTALTLDALHPEGDVPLSVGIIVGGGFNQGDKQTY